MPAWWPDGSRLFFTAARIQGEQPTTYMMNADGTCEGRFAATATQLLRPRWRPGSQPGLGPIRCADLRIRVALAGGAVGPVGLGQDAQYRLDIDNDGNELATGVRLELATTRAALTSASALWPARGRSSTSRAPAADRARRRTLGRDQRELGGRRQPCVHRLGRRGRARQRPEHEHGDECPLVLPCTSVGTWGDDIMYGTPGNDRLCSLTGRDEVYGGKGNDYLDSGNGSDIVAGGPGRDAILSQGRERHDLRARRRAGHRRCGSERDISWPIAWTSRTTARRWSAEAALSASQFGRRAPHTSGPISPVWPFSRR